MKEPSWWFLHFQKKDFMKNMVEVVFFSSIIFNLLSLSTYAENIRLGNSRYDGNGCMPGTSSVTLSPDLKYISLIFDSYTLEAGKSSGISVEHKTCDFLIPIHIPSGYKLTIVEVDYRGYVYLPGPKTTAKLSAKYFLADAMGPPFVKDWQGPLDSNYIFENQLTIANRVHSRCGGDENMRVKTQVSLKNPKKIEDALVTIDSADFDAGLKFKVELNKCN